MFWFDVVEVKFFVGGDECYFVVGYVGFVDCVEGGVDVGVVVVGEDEEVLLVCC